jgi:hypothetical protein
MHRLACYSLISVIDIFALVDMHKFHSTQCERLQVETREIQKVTCALELGFWWLQQRIYNIERHCGVFQVFVIISYSESMAPPEKPLSETVSSASRALCVRRINSTIETVQHQYHDRTVVGTVKPNLH